MIQSQDIPAVGTFLASPVAITSVPVDEHFVPKLVRQWELVELAAQGSLADIFRARPAGSPPDRSADYAIKMLRQCWQDDPQAIGLLQREALVGQSVTHPHLVPILSSAVIEPPRLLVMPWLAGMTVAQRMERKRFGVPEALWVIRQAAEALDALYSAGWMHGDISPGNIHISPAGHVTLLDMSFSRRHTEIGSVVDRPIMGTCGYLAPEYFTSALRPDIRSDIFSLGVILYEMLSGKPPFPAKTLAEMATLHRQMEPPDLARLAPDVPREVIYLVRSMMAREPLRRPQTPQELVNRVATLEIATFSLRP